MKRMEAHSGVPRFSAAELYAGGRNDSHPPFTEPEPGGNLLLEYYRTVARHRSLVLVLSALGLLGGLLLHLTTQPVYRTRTSLDIQSLNGDFLNMRTIDPTAAVSSSETNVQTQIKLLQSESLMDRVQSRLTLEPHADFVLRNDLLSRIQRLLHLGHPGTIPFQALLDETTKDLKVKPLGITRLVEVTCDSWDPAFAATFCNALTSEYEAEDLESRGSEAKRTSDWLMRQASDIREKAEDAQKRLFTATGGNGLILSQESNTVGEDRLRQLQAELVKAQADRMDKEAQTVVARTASPDSTPSIVDSPAYAASRTKLADLENQVATLVPPLTEANPKIIHLRAQIKQVQDSMATQRIDGSRRLQNEYSSAKHREDLLSLAYRTQEAGVSSDLEKGSQVALLRREVESEQQLYQTLLQRAKEAGFASAMQAATIHVVDVARVPRFAFYPQRLTTAAIGLVLGLLVGIVIAFFKDRSTHVVRIPGESQRLLQLEELGVIPIPERSGGIARLLASGTEGAHAPMELPTPDDHPALRNARWDETFSLVAEAYRNATLSIMLARSGDGARTYVVSSPNSGDGKTTVLSNLGVALSKAKLRVVLVDADLRKPSLHRTFAVSNSLGLRDLLRGNLSLSTPTLSLFTLPTAFPNLFVLPAGSGDEEVVEMLHSPRLEETLQLLSESFDVLLIDTPPMLHMVDARVIAGFVDGAILILRSGITTRDQALKARDLLDHDRVRVLGTVLNAFDASKEGQSGYYQSYYAYQRQADAPAVRS